MRNSDLTTREIMEVWGRRRGLIIAATLLCALVAAGISFILPRAYQSSLVIEIGQIYPPTGGTAEPRPEPILLENASALAQSINAGTHIGEALQRMEPNPPPRLEVEAEAFVFGRYEAVLPVIKIIARSDDPDRAVEFLNNLGQIIVAQSRDKFTAYLQSSEEAIENRKSLIADTTGAGLGDREAIIRYRDEIAILRLQAALSTSTRVVKKPSLPVCPVRPKKTLIVITAAFIGLVLSSLIALLQDSAGGRNIKESNQ